MSRHHPSPEIPSAHLVRAAGITPSEISPGGDWELYSYRDHTAALLRRYLRMSLELGRVPSILGGEMFRARVTSYRVSSFEDLVIFVHDVESCLSRLDRNSREIIAGMLFQEYTEFEIASKRGCTVRSVNRWLCEALDEMSEMLLRVHLLEPFNSIGERLAREGIRRIRLSSVELPPKKPCNTAPVHSALGASSQYRP